MTKTQKYYETATQSHMKITKVNDKQAKRDGFSAEQNEQMFQDSLGQQYMIQSLASAQRSNNKSLVRNTKV